MSVAEDRIRWRLQTAISHLEAAAADPGRMGLAYWQTFHALDELDAMEHGIAPAPPTLAVETAEHQKAVAAVARTAARMRSVGIEP